MFSAEGIGKNIEQAIENALLELKASREDVDIKILSEGGLFKKAKVLVTISEDAKEKYDKRAKTREKEKEEEKVEKEVKKETKKAEKQEKKETKAQEKALKEEEEVLKEEAGNILDPVEFLQGLFEVAGKNDFSIEVEEDDKYKTIKITGEDLGDMIGHRGECYYAINKLLIAVSGKTEKKILLDIGDYREKRKEVLTALANRTANRVAKSHRYVRLDPMNPSDRRIIHTALQDDDRVTTLSKGVEPKRYVIVFPKDQDF